MTHFSDTLAQSVLRRRSAVCVGLDPDLARLPVELRAAYAARVPELGAEAAVAACFAEFATGIIDAVADVAAAVKPQAAFFEQCGPPGWEALRRVVHCAREHELPVIVDAKRGDIGSTSRAYADALFGGAPALAGAPLPGLGADAVTLNPYLGDDALAPFVERCADGKGLFVLTRTSNPGAAALQERESAGRPLYLHVADLVARLGADHVGAHGYSDVGAVAGATAPTPLAAVRAALPRAFLLIPGYGAQGAGPEALAGLASGEALGFIVNASRSVIYAWRDRGGDYRSAAAQAATEMRNAIGGP
ncbi:MAG TPA: orotidine-5'-phosphate decarboxylase [Thermoleophilia bacterium]|nr:orotidine-5'-phosphate decarboxylase [Thermoleophilia bacterium]